ncbi:Metallo-dependent hydrolase [Aureobasidium subglaciale]|nr:Metallo-dependent hydrolase [Aureobasidium subglaciale]
MSLSPDLAYTKALPKVELHAHLTGSISRRCLHKIWKQKSSKDSSFGLKDPLKAIPKAVDSSIDVVSFFPIFDEYIYSLVSDEESIRYATTTVLEDFREDGVCYLELRTTPRAVPAAGISKDDYVAIVLQAMADFEASDDDLHAKLILSIDRKNTLDEALEVIQLALKYRHLGVVGIDLCGNPARRPISHLKPAFAEAYAQGLAITLHFAEIAQPDPDELEEMLAWNPQRIGHVIHVPKELRKSIRDRRLGLELCLSCNVLANLSEGGYAAHHFGEWWSTGAPIALSTDDVGIFESSLSSEYLLAAHHFGLDRKQLLELSRSASTTIFGDAAEVKRLLDLLDEFCILA